MSTSTAPVTQEQIDSYRENGYVQLLEFIDAERIEQMKRTMVDAIRRYDAEHQLNDEIIASSVYGRVLNQKVNMWLFDEGMKEIVLDPRLAETARLLTGARGIRLFHDHALLKMPQDSKETPWHQDTPYWPMNENGAMSIWIAMDDVDENNGCLSFIPRSRNLGRLDPVSLTEPRDIIKEYYKGRESAEIRKMRMKAGGVTFHDGLTFHFANANRTDRPRHALAIIYMPTDTTYNGKPHVVTDGLGLEAGKPFDHPHFPLLAGEA